jgi:enoyl-CoA hydratase/carnithine racemase
MDLREVLEVEHEALLALHRDFFTFRSRLRKPVVAMVQGAALAGGVGLVLNCHVVVAESGARFGLTETRIGLWPYVIFPAVAAATGTRKATELALTARIFDAAEAQRIGIVDMLVESPLLETETLRIAANLASGSADAIGNGLQFVAESQDIGPEAVAALALDFRRKTMQSADWKEGVTAFREKRAPLWPSHRPQG